MVLNEVSVMNLRKLMWPYKGLRLVPKDLALRPHCLFLFTVPNYSIASIKHIKTCPFLKVI